jgi:anti-sigma regulatory factor (Ser/Thr protein kinase)
MSSVIAGSAVVTVMTTGSATQTSRLEIELATTPVPARVARAHTARLCRRWGVPDLIPTAELIVAELVTNAVEHGARSRDRVTLTVSLTGRALAIEVADPDPAGPTMRSPGLWDEDGRGTLLVAAHSDRWGWRPHGDGKTVWAELAVAS